MDWGIAWRAALSQVIVVAALGATTGLTLSSEVFSTWGWLIGPVSWLLATLVTIAVWRLPAWPTLFGAIVAGLVSLVGVVTGLHWTGSVIALVLFVLWCAWQGAPAGPAPDHLTHARRRAHSSTCADQIPDGRVGQHHTQARVPQLVEGDGAG